MAQPLIRFLQSTRGFANRKGLVYVIGNESADMDSCCSAITCSYLYNRASGLDTAPMINIPRKDLRLRPDITWLLSQAGIDEAWLLFNDEAPLDSDSQLFLVDHNSPTLPGKVHAIIDHHALEGKEYTNLPGPDIIEKSGSCISLITEHFRKELPNEAWADPALALLGTAPILLDTKNLQYKVEQSDISAIDFFRSLQGPTIETAVLFNDLKTRKKDVSGMSAEDLLNKDFKKWGTVGISSMPLLFGKVLELYPDFPAAMKQWQEKRGLKLCLALASGNNKKQYVRQLAVVKNVAHDLAKEWPQLKLELLHDLGDVLLYNQGEITATRKQIAPLARELV